MAQLQPETVTVRGLRSWFNAHIATMLLLGFASGLPYLLVFSTLSRWLSEAGIERKWIGFLSWASLAYALKFLWAPLLDHYALPVLGQRMGQRKSWLFLSQCAVALMLAGMAFSPPAQAFPLLLAFTALAALASATQDIAIDAYRLQTVPEPLQALAISGYTIGYRIATLVSGAGALLIAEYHGWQWAYLAMAGLMLVGIATTFLMPKPLEESVVPRPVEDKAGGKENLAAWLRKAIAEPFFEFSRRQGKWLFAILALMLTYRASDTLIGAMANPFYAELGFTKLQVAEISKVYGLIVTLLGAVAGGVLVLHFRIWRPLILAGALASASNLIFALMVGRGPDMGWLLLAISADNFANGLAGTIFVALLSKLTNRRFSATQYALFSSLVQLIGKTLGGFSGWFVDIYGYFAFFVVTALSGIPAILLSFWLWRADKGGKLDDSIEN